MDSSLNLSPYICKSLKKKTYAKGTCEASSVEMNTSSVSIGIGKLSGLASKTL
jgi:hypothetical protein